MQFLTERFGLVQARELELLDPDVRRDVRRIDELLHPRFVEIGRSGHRWQRAEIITALAEEQRRVAPETDEWVFDDVGPMLVLVTYRVMNATGVSRHASLWDLSGDTPQIRYHQGTALLAP